MEGSHFGRAGCWWGLVICNGAAARWQGGCPGSAGVSRAGSRDVRGGQPAAVRGNWLVICGEGRSLDQLPRRCQVHRYRSYSFPRTDKTTDSCTCLARTEGATLFVEQPYLVILKECNLNCPPDRPRWAGATEYVERRGLRLPKSSPDDPRARDGVYVKTDEAHDGDFIKTGYTRVHDP